MLHFNKGGSLVLNYFKVNQLINQWGQNDNFLFYFLFFEKGNKMLLS